MTKEKYPHKILIVEDEEILLKTLVDNLLAEGFGHIFQARNGEEGLAMALQEKPDLILLDIVMPKMDGMTMLQKLRQSPGGKVPKVVLLTNLSADDSIMGGVVKNEPSYYLVKADYSIEDVMKRVKHTLAVE